MLMEIVALLWNSERFFFLKENITLEGFRVRFQEPYYTLKEASNFFLSKVLLSSVKGKDNRTQIIVQGKN